MKFRFLGTDACPEEITLRDMTFPKGKPVDVVAAALIEKLVALPYFEVVAERKAKAKPEGEGNAE